MWDRVKQSLFYIDLNLSCSNPVELQGHMSALFSVFTHVRKQK